MLREPMHRLTVFVPRSLHELIQQQARVQYCRTNEYARRALLAAVRRTQQKDSDHEDD
jgi:hypothetical protein